jgi:hypothetical protein
MISILFSMANNNDGQYVPLEQHPPDAPDVEDQKDAAVPPPVPQQVIQLLPALNMFPLPGRGQIATYYKRIFSAKYEFVALVKLLALLLLTAFRGVTEFMWDAGGFDNCSESFKSWYNTSDWLTLFFQLVIIFSLLFDKPGGYRRSLFMTGGSFILMIFCFIWYFVGAFRAADAKATCELGFGITSIPSMFLVSLWAYMLFTAYMISEKYDDTVDNQDVDVALVNKYVQVIAERPELVAEIRNALLRDALANANNGAAVQQ